MANEFTVSYATGNTLYVTAERIYDGTTYTILLTDNGDGTYTGNMNTSAVIGDYVCRVYKQIGASPNTLVDILLNPGETRTWSGSKFDFELAVQAVISPYHASMSWGNM